MGRIGFLREYMNEPLVEGCLFSAKGLRFGNFVLDPKNCLLYTSPSPRDRQKSRMPSSA